MTKTILSLFDYTGNWSDPYHQAGYNVIQVDIKLGDDILTWDYLGIKSVHGILAAPPCTDLSSSGARWWKSKDKDGSTERSLQLVDKTIEIIKHFQPQWWAIENPVGRLPKLRPELGRPFWFQPCDYGDPYTKRTGLFGKFTPPLPVFMGADWSVEPTEGSKMWLLPPTPDRNEKRSATPKGFARAFFIVNP